VGVADGLDVEVLGDGENLGFAAACNRLAEVATAERVMFLNPDTEVHRVPESVLTSSAIVAPAILDELGRQQRTFGPERTLAREAAIRLLHWDSPVTSPKAIEEVGFCSGACFVVNRRRFLEVGGFDTRYFMYYEDLDFSRRWRAGGGSIVVDPEFEVMHVGGVSAAANRLLALQRSFESALLYHGEGRIRSISFCGLALLEAMAKSVIALLVGRAGTVERHTQWEFTRWLVRGRKGKAC
jgi:GT2 family glycosyltransferase